LKNFRRGFFNPFFSASLHTSVCRLSEPVQEGAFHVPPHGSGNVFSFSRCLGSAGPNQACPFFFPVFRIISPFHPSVPPFFLLSPLSFRPCFFRFRQFCKCSATAIRFFLWRFFLASCLPDQRPTQLTFFFGWAPLQLFFDRFGFRNFFSAPIAMGGLIDFTGVFFPLFPNPFSTWCRFIAS